jgi:hypothetical protein
MSIRDLIRELSPPWLRRPWGERFLYAPALALDFVMDWALEGMQSRFPDDAADDALPFIGRDRTVRRGFNEPADIYRKRLKTAVDDHKTDGNPFTLLEAIRAYLFGYAVRVRYVNDRGTWFTINPDGSYEVVRKAFNWDWDGKYPTQAKTRFWIIIYPLASGVWETQGQYGDGQRWGDGRTWGTTATRDQVRSIQALVDDKKTAGSRCPYIIVAFDDASFDPSASPGPPLPDGEYGTWGKDAAGVRVRSRLSTARYWKGTAS